MDERTVAAILIFGGIVLALLGASVMTGALGWFGSLPGDFSHEGKNVRIYAPVGSMIVLSLILSLALAVISRLR